MPFFPPERNTACDGETYGPYDTLEKAKEACSINPNCEFIVDETCDDKEFRLCNETKIIDTTEESCTYKKDPGTKKNEIINNSCLLRNFIRIF